jgi:hypothetical protein
MKRLLLLTGFLLGAALLSPAMADDHHDRRYYHRDGHDYHVYNNQEDRAYRAYLGERHQTYREFHTVKRSQQNEYFRWRHQHPDHTLFKVEVR